MISPIFSHCPHDITSVSYLPNGYPNCCRTSSIQIMDIDMAVCQNPGTPVVHIKIAGKWMFIPPKNGMYRY